MGIDTSGFDSLQDRVEEVKDDYAEGVTYYVSTSVHYGPHQEYGTEDMDAQPFMRPAADKVEAELPEIFAAASSTRQAVKTAAVRCLSYAKQFCPVDTGRLRASIKILTEDGSEVGSATGEVSMGDGSSPEVSV